MLTCVWCNMNRRYNVAIFDIMRHLLHRPAYGMCSLFLAVTLYCTKLNLLSFKSQNSVTVHCPEVESSLVFHTDSLKIRHNSILPLQFWPSCINFKMSNMDSVFMAENLPSFFFYFTNLGCEFGNSEGTFHVFVTQQLAMKMANQLRRGKCLFWKGIISQRINLPHLM